MIELNNSLPPYSFYDNFYFWFNKEKKEEYYATPLYLYNADFTKDDEKKVLTVFWKGKEPTNSPKEHQGLKYPATLYFPYV